MNRITRLGWAQIATIAIGAALLVPIAANIQRDAALNAFKVDALVALAFQVLRWRHHTNTTVPKHHRGRHQAGSTRDANIYLASFVTGLCLLIALDLLTR